MNESVMSYEHICTRRNNIEIQDIPSQIPDEKLEEKVIGLCYFKIHDPAIHDSVMHDSCINSVLLCMPLMIFQKQSPPGDVL